MQPGAGARSRFALLGVGMAVLALALAGRSAAAAEAVTPRLPALAAAPTQAAGPVPFVMHRIGRRRSEACTVGDVNRDGRLDIVAGSTWYEAPTWAPHPFRQLGGKVGEDGKGYYDDFMNALVDVDGDGRLDLVPCCWFAKARRWEQHLIDDTWTQAHSLALADLDGDGDLDLITGKRFMAHNGNDPDETAPRGVYWYALQRGPEPTWTRSTLTTGEGVGAGLSVNVADLDGDADLDLAVTGKWGGPVWFENRRR